MGHEWSGGLLEGLEVVRRPSRWAMCGREAFMVNRQWSEGPPGGPEWSEQSSRGSGVVWSLSLLAGNGKQALQKGWE